MEGYVFVVQGLPPPTVTAITYLSRHSRYGWKRFRLGGDMGKVMALLKERYAGQMDFSKASALVKDKLA